MSFNEESNPESTEDEEILVYVSFEEGTVDREIFQHPDLKFKVIGLDSETPFVQLGDTTFKGSWNEAIGTKVFFEEDFSPEQSDPVFTNLPPRMWKYMCKTDKILELSRFFLKPKVPEENANDSTTEPEPSCSKDIEPLAHCSVDMDLNDSISPIDETMITD